MKKIFPFCLVMLIFACESKNNFSINLHSENSQLDTLLITEQITENILFKIPLKYQKTQRVQHKIDYTTIGSIQSQNGEKSYLTILHPRKTLNVIVKSDSSILNDDLADSLLNYLWKSTNEFIAQNSNFIFTTNDPDTIVTLFKKLTALREVEFKKRSSALLDEEKSLLLYQNTARIHSFLFYFGRLVKNFPASHKFFSFIADIDDNTGWAKTLPYNLLYKHEINYLLRYKSIGSNESFINYLAEQTKNQDLLDYLKVIYISEVITSPSYWKKHEGQLNPQILREIIAGEESNKYNDIIVRPSASFFSSQKGVKAFNFVAEKVDGSIAKLSDFKGKLVFIDSWASWCGPCIAHRPAVLQLAKKYEDNDHVEVLMISMDADKSDWLKYLEKEDQMNIPGNLIIEKGMDSEFGDHFNVRQIPKYILINKEGIIVNSNIPEPSIAVEEMIEYELGKSQLDPG